MNIIVIEDEKPAAEKLKAMLEQQDNGRWHVSAMLHSVATAVEWLKHHPQPDVIFMDIELGDGVSFDIFRAVTVSCPVIVTTAYDEYWLDAFECNGIDYLLKPLKQDKVEAALRKYDRLNRHFATNLHQLPDWTKQAPTPYKKRWLVKKGSEYMAIKSEDIAYLYAAHKLVCMVNMQNQKFLLDNSLAEIEKELDPALFFRINRKYLAQINAIARMKAYPKGKILVELSPAVEEEIIISQEQVAAFKNWVSG